jgi:glycosyltransferase involved in cell wall biosynthesis
LRGGVETIVNDLTRVLPKHGWDTILGLAKGARFNDIQAYQSEYPELSVMEIVGTKGTRQARLQSLAGLIKQVQPDVVLAARIFDAYEVVSLLKQSGGPRLAIIIRGYEPHYLFDAKVYKDNIDLCIVDGNLLTFACVDWCGLESDRVLSIPSGIEPAKSSCESRPSPSTIRIGYVGRLAQSDKRALDIVPLVRRLDERALEFHLKIVGEGPEEAVIRGQLHSFVSDGRVTFHGWQTHEQLYRDIYPNLDCIVNFSPAEGVTISGREAMVHGVVPVMSRFVGMTTEGLYIHDLNSLVFPVGDIAAAAEGILRLKNEAGLINRLSMHAVSSQTGKYSYEGAIAAWTEALDRCLEQPPAIGPVPKLSLPPDGRLTRFGLSPRIAQMIRNSLGMAHLHNDPGSEWPTGSGLIDPVTADEIIRFAVDYENGVDAADGNLVA